MTHIIIDKLVVTIAVLLLTFLYTEIYTTWLQCFLKTYGVKFGNSKKMKPKTWQIFSLFQNFSNNVTTSASYANISLFLVLYFVEGNLLIQTFKETQENSPDLWNYICRSTVSLSSINLGHWTFLQLQTTDVNPVLTDCW